MADIQTVSLTREFRSSYSENNRALSVSHLSLTQSQPCSFSFQKRNLASGRATRGEGMILQIYNVARESVELIGPQGDPADVLSNRRIWAFE